MLLFWLKKTLKYEKKSSHWKHALEVRITNKIKDPSYISTFSEKSEASTPNNSFRKNERKKTNKSKVTNDKRH